ncbi:hypothetical protein JCM8547_009194 [Rhodosporidiobolus lusitaniae]
MARRNRHYRDASESSSDASFLSESSSESEGSDEERRVGLRSGSTRSSAGTGKGKRGRRTWVMGSQPKSSSGQRYQDAGTDTESEPPSDQSASDGQQQQRQRAGNSSDGQHSQDSQDRSDSEDEKGGAGAGAAGGAAGAGQNGQQGQDGQEQNKNTMWYWIGGGVVLLIILCIAGYFIWKNMSSDDDSDSSTSSSSIASAAAGLNSAIDSMSSSAVAESVSSVAAATAALTTSAAVVASTSLASSNSSGSALLTGSGMGGEAGASGLSATKTSAVASATSDASAEADTATFAAQITWFQANGSQSECLTTANDGDYVVHISAELYGTSTPVSGLCGKWMTLYQLETDSYARATIEGICQTCTGRNLDLSRATFNALTQDMELGTTLAHWWWTDAAHQPDATLSSSYGDDVEDSETRTAQITGALGAGTTTQGSGTVGNGEKTTQATGLITVRR